MSNARKMSCKISAVIPHGIRREMCMVFGVRSRIGLRVKCRVWKGAGCRVTIALRRCRDRTKRCDGRVGKRVERHLSVRTERSGVLLPSRALNFAPPSCPKGGREGGAGVVVIGKRGRKKEEKMGEKTILRFFRVKFRGFHGFKVLLIIFNTSYNALRACV